MGGEWDNSRANVDESGLNRTTAVGMYPHAASLIGALDMSGNVWEWCLNEHGNPENIELGGEKPREMRGGSFDCAPINARCGHRLFNPPYHWGRETGFRVCYGAVPM
jgi:formylglycine-generating enzyme required for sulfatase activity